MSSREYMQQSGERAEITHEIILRAGPTIRPRDRIKYGDRVFDVVGSFDIAERGRHIRVSATESLNG